MAAAAWTTAGRMDSKDKKGTSRIEKFSVRDFCFQWPGPDAFIEEDGEPMRKLLVIGMGLVLLGIGPGVRADQKVTLDTVVVTATKTQEKRKDISNSMVVKDNKDIQEAPADNLGELLANEPGIDWRTYGDYGGASQSFMIRGMESKEAVVMVNGLTLNSPSLGEADVGGILLNNIERVEVVKGSGSLLYGSGAMAGTVNVITKSPSRERMDLSVRAGYGSQGTYQVSAENGLFITRDLGYYLTANHLTTDGHRDNGDLTHNDASLKLVLDKGGALNIDLYGQIVHRKYGTPGIHPPEGTADFNLPATGERLYSSESASLKSNTDAQDIHTVLEIEGRPADWLRWRAAGKYIRTESIHESWLNADTYSGMLAGEGTRSTVINSVPGAEADVEIQPLDGATLLIGTDFQDHEWDTKSTELNIDGTAKGADTTNDADIYSLGTFAEGQYRPSKYIKLQAGLRQEHHATFGTEYLPRYGLIINPFETTAIKINRGKHFKAPTPNDLFWPEDSFVRGNPNLKAQTGWHTDVTAEQQFADDRLFLTASYFNWNIRDKITWAENPAFPGPYGNNKYTPTNLNRSRAYGFEAGVRYDLLRQLALEAGYTRTMAKEEVGTITRRARYVPDYQCKFSATYRNDVGTLVTATWRYTDERFNYRSDSVTAPDDILKAYATVDLKVEQRFLEHWLVSVDGRNLLDEAYDTYINSFVDSTGSYIYGAYPGAGRSLFAAVTYEY
jgi:outer membrane receptor protein involved in Fe transport